MRFTASPARRSPRRTPDPTLVSLAREVLDYFAIAALVAAGTYAVALNRRSWPLWLLAFALTIVTLWVAYFLRDSERTGPRGRQVVLVRADANVTRVASTRRHAGSTLAVSDRSPAKGAR